MDVQTALPTGRRKITLPQLRAETARAVPLLTVAPGRVLAAFKRAEPALGALAQVVKLIDYLVGRTQAEDWSGSGLGPIAWPSDAELEDRLGVGPTQRKAVVNAALDAGYLRLRRSPNGKRYGHRDKQGRITDAYGFDLAPLAQRMAEFERLAAEWEARRNEGRRLRREITCSRNAVLSLVDLAVLQDVAGEDWPAVAVQTDALWRQRGRHRDPLALVPIAARLRALRLRVQEQVTAAVAFVDSVETDPMGPEYRPHLTTTNQLSIAEASVDGPGTAGPDRPMAHEEERSRDQAGRRVVAEQAQGEPTRNAIVPPSALRGFVVTPGFILAIAPAFRDWVSSARPGWNELDQAAAGVRTALGISPHAWGQAYLTLGREEAITALAAICARHAAGKVVSPGSLLRCMVELHGKGSLRLDRTLFGLADGLRKKPTIDMSGADRSCTVG